MGVVDNLFQRLSFDQYSVLQDWYGLLEIFIVEIDSF
jgi:hypothetical protein